MDEYKDSEKLLEEAQSKLDALEESERIRKKMTITLCVIAAIGIGSFLPLIYSSILNFKMYSAWLLFLGLFH